MSAAAQLQVAEVATHTAPSGVGFVFEVVICGRCEQPGHVKVRVISAHPEWDGHEFFCREQDVRPIDREVR